MFFLARELNGLFAVLAGLYGQAVILSRALV
jgi:hypothetical protein